MKPIAKAEQVDRMIFILMAHPEGMSAALLSVYMQMPVGEAAKRRIRALAEAAGSVIVSAPGIGYKHYRHASQEDFNHAANAIEAQATKMLKKAEAIRQRALEAYTPELQLI